MPKRIAVTTLNASTIDILNTIRENASMEYQNLVPVVETEQDVRKVGDVLYGYPALANQFINALVNRIALVKVKSANFNNMYADLKKGYLEFGETVEEVFVNIAKAREFSVEKAAAREFKRTLPDVRSAFHTMNWRVQYPITIQDEELRMAFTSMDGVQDLITKIVDSVYVANEYDEYLLFKYLMIKAITKGKMYPVAIDADNIKDAAKKFRSYSNQLQFLSKKYNAVGVNTSTSKEDQHIFMDSAFNAEYDVDVLAAAFNMDKAEFTGKLRLIDDWTTFDNERFESIMDGSDMVEPVTAAELAIMKNVKAVLVDQEWFQIYDNNIKFTEDYVAAGMYWNYFLNVWKTVSSSPFSNAIVFVSEDADIEAPEEIQVEVLSKDVNELATVMTLGIAQDSVALVGHEGDFKQTKSMTENGVAMHKYGAIIMPANANAEYIVVDAKGTIYRSTSTLATNADVGDLLTLQQEVAGESISFDKQSLTFASSASDPADITATTVPADLTLEWESEDELVATVEAGTVTPIGAGTTTVSASYSYFDKDGVEQTISKSIPVKVEA